ncbi:MAG: peptide chain release factor 1 [SAR202 cluster bacterium]|nr:peptide chain release factor 1 [SAR202 cluster bacterium]MDP6713143.1 peptide chain release factor 1 [SAR202 cluster bacterium]
MQDRLAAVVDRYEEIQQTMADPEVAVDYTRIQALAMEQASIKTLVELAGEYRQLNGDITEVKAMIREESDEEMTALAREELAELEGRLERVENSLRVELIPKDPNDGKNVIMEIRAGAGGDEAGLFAAAMYRMYSHFAQRNGWKTDVIDANQTGLGAIKEIVFEVRGKEAYSRLKYESGVHRVQRIPVTESNDRIHTSTATVAVMPEAEEVDINVNPDDLQIDIFHSSGHGGQNVQKVATAIRITHKPTGVVAICQDERSQLKNKEKAMAVLRSRLLAAETERADKERSDFRRSQVGTGDRSERVRTYNFPQSRITDHRIGLTIHSLEQAMDGDIDTLVDGLVEHEEAMALESAAQ